MSEGRGVRRSEGRGLRSGIDAFVEPEQEIAPARHEAPLLRVDDLTITYRGASGRQSAVRGVSFEIHAREAFGLVGESGCGKSTIAFAIMRHLAANGRVAGGSLQFDGIDLLALSASELQRVRGRRIAMVYQDPGAALNPAMSVGEQIVEVYQAHADMPRAQAEAATVEMLERVRMPGAGDVARRYPHQLSGGMQQRAVIAMALATNPQLLILDEPTTGLDATVEAAVLDLVTEIRQSFNAAILFISHNLAVVARVCDRVGVLYAGELVEQGDTAALFALPHHPYTAGLLACVPRRGADKITEPLVPIAGHMPRPAEELPGCVFAPRCALVRDACRQENPPLAPTTDGRLARCFFWAEAAGLVRQSAAHGDADTDTGGEAAAALLPRTAPLQQDALLDVRGAKRFFGRASGPIRAVDDVSFGVERGQIFGLVGESGSGKSTLARCIAGLLAPSGGAIRLEGRDLAREVERRSQADIKGVQMVFQSPEATLNPRQTVRGMLERTARALTDRRGADLRAHVENLARLVHIDPELLDSFPGNLSGGQRQRAAIARAFAGDPAVVLCDEPVSNLDVSVQAAILNLIADLQRQQRVSFVFISHDLAVVRYLADQVGVMYLGALVEIGPVARVFTPPSHPYTETLFAAMPSIDGVASSIRAEGSMPSAAAIPPGCPFHTRCPRFLGEQCATQVPPWQNTTEGHSYRCWIPPHQLTAAQADAGTLPRIGTDA